MRDSKCFIAAFPYGNILMYLIGATVAVIKCEIDRDRFCTLIGDHNIILIPLVCYMADGKVCNTIVKKPAFPEPVEILPRAGIDAIEKIIRHGMFAMPFGDIMMQGFSKQRIA